MTVLRNLRGEKRAINAADFPLANWVEANATDSGITVDKDSAFNYIPVWSCIKLLGDTVAELPVDVYRRKGGGREQVAQQPAWLMDPNDEDDPFSFWFFKMVALNADGNSFDLITARDRLGYPAEFFNLVPSEVKVDRDSRGRIVFDWKGQKTYTKYSARHPEGQVLHIKAFNNGGDRGLNPIEAARQGIGVGLVTERHGARFFGNGSQPSGVLTLPEGASFTDDDAKVVKNNWIKRNSGTRNSHLPAVVGGGATWTPITMPNDTAQFLETRKFQRSEIAMFFRVPPHMIGDVEKTTSWGTGIEQQSIGFVTYSIMPWLRRLEMAFNQCVPRGQFLKWNVNGLLRGDAAARGAYYQLAIQNGFMTRNEVRALEDLDPLDGLDEPLVPNANAVPANQGRPKPDED